MNPASWQAMRSFSRDSSVTSQRLKPGTVRRIASYARPYRGDLTLFMVATALDAVVTVAVPLLLGLIVNKIEAKDTSAVLTIAAAVAGIALFDAFLSIAQRWYSARVGEGLIYDLRTEVFRHVQQQPIAFFTRAQTGSLVSRLNSDVIGAQQAITSTLSGVVSNALSLVLVLAAMFYLSPVVTLAALVLIPVFILPARALGRRMQRLTRESMQLDAAMGSTMTERFNVAGAMLVKLFGRPGEEAEVFSGRAARVRDIGVVTAMYGRVFFIALVLLASMATALVYGLGGSLVIDGTISLGALVALASLLSRMYGPITALSNVQVDVMTALVSFDRVFEVLDLKPLIQDRPGAIALPRTAPAPAPAPAAAPAAAGSGGVSRTGAAGKPGRSGRAGPGDRVRPRFVPLPGGVRGVAGLAGVDRAARARACGRQPGGAQGRDVPRAVRPAHRPGRAVGRGQDHDHAPGVAAV